MTFEKLMSLHVLLGACAQVGDTGEGTLTIIPIIGGTFSGARLRGEVCASGADWNTRLSDTASHVLARYHLKTDDGVFIAIENEGFYDAARGGVLRTTPRFRCDKGCPYAFLNTGAYAGELRAGDGASVDIDIYEIT